MSETTVVGGMGYGIKKICTVFLCVILVCCCAVPYYAAKNEDKVIHVGWYDTDGGSGHNYDYEYLQALSQYTGWTYEYVDGSWDECLKWLEDGEIDILGFVNRTAEREKIYGYPDLPMATTGGFLVVDNSSDTQSSDLPSMSGVKVGIVKGVSFNKDFEQYSLDNGIDAEYVKYSNLSDIAPALKSGEIDAAVVAEEDKTASEHVIAKLSSQNQYFATDIDDPKLLKELNEAMVLVNTYCPYLNNDLYQKYLAVQSDGKPVFDSNEMEFIKNNPTITVLIDAGWPPVEYYDEKTDSYKGIFPDPFDLISQKSGLKFKYEGTTSGGLLAEMASGERKNLLTPISYDYAWAEQHEVYITQPFVTSQIVKLGKNLNEKNPTAAINKDAYFAFALSKELEGVDVLSFPKQAERLEAIRTGTADYTFVTEDQANYYRSIPKYSDLEMERMIGYEQKVCICIGKNSDPELMSIVSKTLACLTHDEATTILRNNTVNSYEWTLSDFLYAYHIPLVIIVVLLAIIIVTLVYLSLTRKKNAQKLEESYQNEQKAHEQEKLALKAAESASKAKGDFMSRMSHEIRTPLNAVIGYNMIMRSEMDGDKNEAERRRADMKIMDCLTKSELASKHLLTIINDVLDMSAIESGKIKVAHDQFDFRNLISSLTVLFFSQAKAKGVDFEVLFDKPTEEWFVGDQMRINQVLTNLLSNAVKFTPDGGSVKLIVKQQTIDEKTIRTHFEITDTGIGMTQEYIGHIWTPFEQEEASISRRFGGTGLGLSITKNLVELMGGTINVESESSVGTTFCVDINLERMEQPLRARTSDFSDINVLIVDDDISTCDYISLLFNHCGASCMAVTSGEAAVNAYKSAAEQGKPFNLCLIDWHMPHMDGVETVRRIRATSKDEIPILIITAYDFSEISEAAEEAGINMFVSKPLFQSSLFDVLATVSEKNAYQKIERNAEFDFSGAKVLLVEDNKMNMEVGQHILQSSGLSVDCAWNGQEAIDIFTSSAEDEYAAILMDVHMPEVDGYQATRTIRASSHPQAASVSIIAMTADAFTEDVTNAHEAGMNDHIAKPIDMQSLFEILKKYIPNNIK